MYFDLWEPAIEHNFLVNGPIIRNSKTHAMHML